MLRGRFVAAVPAVGDVPDTSSDRLPGGFTLIELAVVVVIVGVLAAFAVPRFLHTVERAKASEAFAFLASVQSAEEMYRARQGGYTSTLDALDGEFTELRYFQVGEITADQVGWRQVLTRTGASSGYGTYTVTFTHEGYDGDNSTIVNDISPMQSD